MKRRGIRSVVVGAALAAVALVASSLPAVALDLTFERTWGGGGSTLGPAEQGEGVAVAPDGSSYVVGQTNSFGTGANDGRSNIFLLKYASDGTLVWQRTYGVEGSGQNAFGMDVAVALDGTVWVTGELRTNVASVLLARFDADGNLLSERTFTGLDSPRALDIADDGSIYVTGFTFPGAGQGDAFVLKAAADGTPVWVRTWGSADSFDIGNDVATATDGSVYLAADTNGFSGNGAALVKFDSDGNVVWARDWLVGTLQDFSTAQSVAVDLEGNAYLAGNAISNALLVKVAADGSVLWERTWAGRDSSTANSVAVAPAGIVYIAGNKATFKVDDLDALVVGFQPTGRVDSAATWGAVNRLDDPAGASNQGAQAVAVADDGSLHVAGGTSGPPPYEFAKASRKTATPVTTVGNPDGTVTTPQVTVTDPNGTVLVPNGSETYAGGSDAALLKLAP